MKLLSAETTLTSATNVGNKPLVRVYNSHDADTLTVTRKDNSGDTIGTYNLPPDKVIYCEKDYTDTLEGGAALKATAIGYSEMLDIISLGGGSAYVTQDLVFYVDAAKSDSYPGSGTTWFDLSGNDYDTSIVSGNSFPTFNSEGYFTYNKSMNVLSLPDNATLNESNQAKKTFSVWFKTPSSFDASAARGIFVMGGTQANWVIYIQDNDLYMGAKSAGSGNNWTTPTGATTALTASTWYNATMVLDAEDNTTLQDNVLKLYVNGSSIGTAQGHRMRDILNPGTIGGGAIKDLDSNTELFGRSVHGDDLYEADVNGDSAYDGLISIVMVYNQALTDAEVTQNYNAFKGRYGY